MQLEHHDDIVNEAKMAYSQFEEKYMNTSTTLLVQLNCMLCKTTISSLLNNEMTKEQFYKCDILMTQSADYFDALRYTHLCATLTKAIVASTLQHNITFDDLFDVDIKNTEDIITLLDREWFSVLLPIISANIAIQIKLYKGLDRTSRTYSPCARLLSGAKKNITGIHDIFYELKDILNMSLSIDIVRISNLTARMDAMFLSRELLMNLNQQCYEMNIESDYSYYCSDCTHRRLLITDLDHAINRQRALENSFRNVENTLNTAIQAMNKLEPSFRKLIWHFKGNNITQLQLGEFLGLRDRNSLKVNSEISNIVSGAYQLKWHAQHLNIHLSSVYESKMTNKFPSIDNLIIFSNYILYFHFINYNDNTINSQLVELHNALFMGDIENSSKNFTKILLSLFQRHDEMMEDFIFTLESKTNDFMEYEAQYTRHIAEYRDDAKVDTHFLLYVLTLYSIPKFRCISK